MKVKTNVKAGDSWQLWVSDDTGGDTGSLAGGWDS